ncbi:hypothetical protein GCM10008905_19830 [Clostridium malenominatum]|uniref:Small, acid-soluble spore protein H n=1 Tax=Clostridium malenominatum TaxID=1539 RepID=A0ABN1J150_9CLOT
MNNQRAKNIIASSDMITVTYNGTPVYLEAVNDNNNTAKIHYLDHPENKQEVPLDNLVEH